MKISVVTISYNQAQFIEEAILSVISQNYNNFEYIIVDPGSSDGSREIIEKYARESGNIITLLEKDQGPADGLNKGFLQATGDIFCFLNSDDQFLPNAFEKIADCFNKNPLTDVVSGHALVINAEGKTLRKVYSDAFSILSYAYGSSILIQPSTFFRKSAYIRSKGFNISNRSNWDGELWADLYFIGARFKTINFFLSCYRLQAESITTSGKYDNLIKDHHRYMFEKIVGRKYEFLFDSLIRIWFLCFKYINNPHNTYERIFFGKMYKRN
jgi:glycosyltransferase involved in cell wall biosynthesis